MSTSPTAIFSGTSRFSTDFQNIITRTVNIASLPLTQLQQQETHLNDQSTALGSLSSKFASLQTALTSLSNKIGVNASSATPDDPTVATASAGAGATPGTYSLEVLNLGARSVTLSNDGLPTVSDPSSQDISNSSSLTLTVAGTNYTISNGVSSLSGLAAQINAANAGVQATVINIGSSTTPDYRLSVLSTKLGDISIQLTDGSAVLLNTIASGSLAAYRVNGVPANAILSDTRNVTLSPGIQASILKPGTTNITVNQVSSGIEAAVSDFVTAFNGAVDETNKHRGTANGALAGSSLVSSLTNSLRQLAGYSTGNSGISSLTSLGLNFDQTGHIQFDKATFEQAAQDPTALTAFLGSSIKDGFFQYANDILNSVEDPATGNLTSAINLNKQQINKQDDLIASEQDRVDLLRTTVTNQMAQADALIASMEQQVTYITGLFSAMKGTAA